MAAFEDGAESHGSTMIDGVDYEIVETGRHPGEDRLRPKTEIVGWLLSCDCRRSDSSEVSTWTDPVQWARVPDVDGEISGGGGCPQGCRRAARRRGGQGPPAGSLGADIGAAAGHDPSNQRTSGGKTAVAASSFARDPLGRVLSSV